MSHGTPSRTLGRPSRGFSAEGPRTPQRGQPQPQPRERACDDCEDTFDLLGPIRSLIELQNETQIANHQLMVRHERDRQRAMQNNSAPPAPPNLFEMRANDPPVDLENWRTWDVFTLARAMRFFLVEAENDPAQDIERFRGSNRRDVYLANGDDRAIHRDLTDRVLTGVVRVFSSIVSIASY